MPKSNNGKKNIPATYIVYKPLVISGEVLEVGSELEESQIKNSQLLSKLLEMQVLKAKEQT